MSDTKPGEGGQNHPFHSPNHISKTLVVVGTETALFDKSSKVRERILASFAAFQHVHIIVMCEGSFKMQSEGHITMYPTNSRPRFMRVLDAVRIGRRIRQADIVTVQDPFESGLAGWLIARKLKAALHVQVHTDFLSPEYAKLSLINRLRLRIADFVLPRAAHIRVVSERIKRSIKNRTPKRTAQISVLPIFVDLERMRTGLKDYALEKRFSTFAYRLLIVSRLEREKNVEMAIHAFKKVSPPNTCLIIVGDGSEMAELRNASKGPGNTHIFFEGRREPSTYFSMADLVLFPSHYDGYGMVIVEALAAGKPVLSTDVGIAREAGAIVTTEEKFVNALAQWFKDGPRTGELKYHPYRDFDEYLRAYSEDIAACPHTKF